MPAETPTTATEGGRFSTLHPDIIKYHVLTRLDGPSLGSAACCSSTLRHLSFSDDLWSSICRSTWPSTASPRLSRLISTFPGGGARAFFSQAYPILSDAGRRNGRPPPPELISAVDIHFNGELIFSKVQETETDSDWFRCSPFRVDLLEPKDAVPTPIRLPAAAEEDCAEVAGGMTLSWILVDPAGGRAVNLSSIRPVGARRHWLTGEVQVRYLSVVAAAHVQCGVVVTCGEKEGGGGLVQVREVSLEMEDVDGTRLNGRDSLIFLQGALDGGRGTGRNRVEEGLRRYGEYVEMRRERRERRMRREGVMDVLCVAFGVCAFLLFCCFLVCG
ncbi:F-box family protein [Striga asiatica]|uniref:F-box family protein n=1 Tax=Striga asiatica TaxID=4170 RepID=A0A5A7P880_STRAF|nr:F-box family protein [Striga asiatica]